ncbi:hypothetical protein VE01_08735 [Pseudogymnoascus verrucosus]|uniref:Phosphogluconate dehydrogenase NAD-binding putative C-terminal domain-containing protein n=1 Tax=Pseudogymnoascus verrucosus TaxID=342668 RepID=A0A1B8GC46_9PEZI|nr:uncharacterized protein VE01_08735 [Pseudogymnoascus verrucosus]OBT93393.1 hypothetical protein VE01_08735 [Pseudogymnoascus verrucosus]
MASSTLATVGVLSIGEMGLGVAKLLIAHNYRVVTNITGRSKYTQERAEEGKIETLSTDEDVVREADYILSIVPPRDALATAQRVADVLQFHKGIRSTPLYYLDLNAVSPRSARTILNLFRDPNVAIPVDGGIFGGPPSLKDAPTDGSGNSSWYKPKIPTSGPYKVAESPKSGQHLAETLNIRHISDDIGQASGLKMCFASTMKGFSGILTQSFTTAQQLGVLDELKTLLGEISPATLHAAENSVPRVPPKAYRWVAEMEEIAATFSEEAGFEKDLFLGVAGVYKTMSNDTVLGQEKTGYRKRGRTVEDVASAMNEGLQAKKKKSE